MDEKRAEKKNKIFKELTKDISVNAIQIKDFGQQKSEGYNIGYLVERLNDALIPEGWNWTIETLPFQIDDGPPRTFLLETIESTTNQGKKSKKTTVSVRVKVQITDEMNEVVWVKESFGGCQMLNNSLGDTLKGAQTDGLKKALSYLGIGNAAFKGTINDQIRWFSYFKKDALDKIKGYFEKNKSEYSEKRCVAFVSKIVKKDYLSLNDVLYSDWLLILDFVTRKDEDAKPKNTAEKKATSSPKKKVVDDESKDRGGEDKASPAKK